MGCLGAWFSGGHGSAKLKVEFNDLKGLFQPKPLQFHDSMIYPFSTSHPFKKSLGSSFVFQVSYAGAIYLQCQRSHLRGEM